MTDRALTITFSGSKSPAVPVSALLLEQKPWRPYTGYLTTVGLVKALANRLYSAQYDNLVNCGMAGDQVVCTVYGYPYASDLNYTINASRGRLSDRVIDDFEFEELINMQLSRTASIKYPAHEILSADWVGDVWDVDGNVITGPDPVVDGVDIIIDRPVYGGLRVRYRVTRHTYLLSIAPRDEAIENLYSSVVYGVYAGGITWIEIEPPPGAEEFYTDAECGYGSGGSGSVTAGSGPSAIPTDVYGDRIIKKDYCSQNIILDEVYGL